MDLSALRPTNAGEILYLDGPNGRPLTRKVKGTDGVEVDKQLWIKLASADSALWKKVQRANTNRHIEAANKARGKAVITSEMQDADGIECLVAVTQDWGEIVLDGAPLDCTPENAKRLYREIPLIFEQAYAYATNRENFLKGDSTT